jgi:hypothetical protein
MLGRLMSQYARYLSNVEAVSPRSARILRERTSTLVRVLIGYGCKPDYALVIARSIQLQSAEGNPHLKTFLPGVQGLRA